MKHVILLMMVLCYSFNSDAQKKQTEYAVADSMKVSGLLTEINIQTIHPRKENKAGIRVDDVILFLEADKKEREIGFEFPETATVLAAGVDVEKGKDELEWHYNWQLNQDYRLMLQTATDSAGNFKLYSAYVWFTKDNKWKLIGTVKVNGTWGTIKSAAAYEVSNASFSYQRSQAWMQRTNGSWKNLLANSLPNPVPAPMSNIDSTQQAAREEQIIQQLIKENKTDAVQKHEDVYYKIITQGSGKKVNVTDTVTVHYKGSLLSDGTVFDQTREKPATFPLNRLIKGWQIGVPLLNVGGKIKIVIPSGLAYSIRTRSPKIPPNSILVFEVEVLEAK